MRAMLAFAFVFVCLAQPASPAESGEEDGGTAFADIAEAFREHCVRVFIRAGAHEGALPSAGAFGDDALHERATRVGGYWWDERHVVIHDPVLPAHFIRSIEIAPPGGGARFPARVAGHFTRMDALLLEVLPDARGELPGASPLPFVEGDVNEAIVLSYGCESGEWRLTLDSGSGLGDISLSDGGEETAALSAQGVLLTPEGEVFGLSFGDEVVLAGGDAAFFGPETVESPFLWRDGANGAEALRERLRDRLAGAVLETVIRLRITVDEEEDASDEALLLAADFLPDGSAELRTAGLVVGARTLLVPLALPPEGIARVEGIRVVTAEGAAIPARFAGALREYLAILVETDADFPVADLPPGFTLLNPFLPLDADAPAFPLPSRELILRHRVDYSLGRRREVADYDRWLGIFQGYRDDPLVRTRTNERDAALAFDTEGRLVALALTPRLVRGGEEVLAASPAFRPVDFLARRLRAEDAIDPSLRPEEEERSGRLIDFGVEFQPLDANTARLFDAARATRGGDIGLLVTHVYPGSLAEGAGVREHDVLLRFFLEGRGEPVELRADAPPYEDAPFEPDMSGEELQRMLRYMPPPWPPRENAVSALLTGLGAGKRVEVEYLRGGEPRRASFGTALSPPDYRSARRERFALLGLTAKPLTYEVRRFFKKEEGGGVVVSAVEEGGKASVAGLHPYLLITHADGRALRDLDDFAARVKNFEEGASPSVELTVESFGKTRLVKIE